MGKIKFDEFNENGSLADIIEGKGNDHGMTFITKDGEEYIGYADIYCRALKILSYLQDRGVEPGNEVVLQLAEDDNFICAFWSCQLGGFTVVPLAIGNTNEQRKLFFNARKKLNRHYVITTKKYAELLKETCAIEKISDTEELKSTFIFIEDANKSETIGKINKSTGQNLACIQFSSGSTGQPKGVMLTHGNLLSNIKDIYILGEYSSTQRSLCWTPLTHTLGLLGFHLGSVFADMDQYLLSTQLFLGDPLIWMAKCSEKRIDMTYTPPSGLGIFIDAYRKVKEHYNWDLSNLRFYVGAEPISTELCDAFIGLLRDNNLSDNCMKSVYGLTESSGLTAALGVSEKLTAFYADRNTLGIGDKVKSLMKGDGSALSFAILGYGTVDSTSMRICDEKNNILQHGRVGYIQLKGKTITPGYYNDPKNTEALFTSDHWLNTGDLGFIYHNGLVVTGRGKEIIFVNGKNYYPNDIERLCQNVEGVHEGKVVACGNYNHKLHMDELLLFIISEAPVNEFVKLEKKIRKHILERININVDKIIPVSEFERTRTGKVQRFRLIEHYNNGDYNDIVDEMQNIGKDDKKSPVTELSETERRLVKIWEEVLGVEHISINDNFFELGGQSVKMATVVAKINVEFNSDINAGTIFKCKTIANLKEYISIKKGVEYQTIGKIDEADYYQTSSAQKRIYLLSNMKYCDILYNIPIVIEVPGVLKRNRLIESFHKLIRKHESLRTYFLNKDGEIVQCITDRIDAEVVEKDISDCDDAKTAISNMVKSFDLSKPPLIRMTIFHQSEEKEYILLDMHHIISDGSSIGILVKDLIDSYEGTALEQITVTYKDFASWQNQIIKTDYLESQKRYWMDRFSDDIPILNLPTDYMRPADQQMNGHRIGFRILDKRYQGILDIVNQTKSTLYMVLLSIFNVLLYKLTEQEDIVIGSPIAGRNHPDIQKMVGMFVNTLAMKNNPHPDLMFNGFLETVKTNTIDAMSNSDLQLEELVDMLGVRRDLSRNPLFDVMFTLQNMYIPELNMDNMKIRVYEADCGISKFDLTLYTIEEEDGISCELEYADDLFTVDTVQRFINGYFAVIDAVIHDDSVLLKDISIIAPEEKQMLIRNMSNNKTDYPKDKTLALLFEEQVQKNPNKIAIVSDDGEMTYGELNRCANQLAHHLRDKGIQSNTIVSMFINRSAEMVIGILAVLKAGGAYLPIDTILPEQRICDLIEDSKTKLLLVQTTTKAHCDQIANRMQIEMIVIDSSNPVFQDSRIENPAPINQSTDLAYLMYTSGSTGEPKGNLTRQFSISRVVKNTNYIEITSDDTLLQLSNYAFDGSTFDIFGSLLNGAKLVLIKKEIILDVNRLADLISVQNITIFFITTALFNTLIDTNIQCFKGIRKVLFGGERVSKEHVVKAFHYMGSGKMIHVYGPTESTVFTTYHPVDCIDNRLATIPIGTPIANTEVYIMDSTLSLQPVGVPGELCIAGDGLIDGYLNREETTREKFVNTSLFPAKTIYKSGDLARWLPSGEIEFLDRIDTQVKIRGFRIELGEIENRLLMIDGVKEAVVIPIQDKNMNLAAYYTSDEEMNNFAIKESLAKTLPPYMLPLYYKRLEKIPLNINGKVNKSRLPIPDSPDMPIHFVEATDGLEKQITDVWKEILKIDCIGIYDNFFDLGGNSLLIMGVHNKLRALCDFDIKVTDLFANPTVHKLTSFINEKMKMDKNVLVQFAAYTLPEDYFTADVSESAKHGVCVGINDKLYARLNDMKDEYGKVDFLLAGYVCLLYKLTGKEEIELCWLNQENKITVTNVSVNDTLELDVLMKQIIRVREESSENRIYDVFEVKQTEVIDEKHGVRILWCDEKISDVYSELHRQFSLMIKAEDYLQELTLECEYDVSKLKQDKVVNLLELIMSMTDVLLEERGDDNV